MGMLKYISGTLIAPNLAGYLLTRGLVSIQEKQLARDINDRITNFNRNFDDKEVDSNHFVEFLKQKDINSAIFDRVFNTYNIEHIDYKSLSKSLASDAIAFVNVKKKIHEHPAIKRPMDFEDYFKELFDVLLELRDSLLGLGGQALASTITDSLNRTEESITQTMTTMLGGNSLLEEKIEEMEMLINRGEYDAFEERIEDIFDTVTNISTEQRIRLLFQKARKFINTGDYDKLLSIKNRISRCDNESRFIDEIDYWIAYNEFDNEKIELSINKLKGKGVSEVNLNLKKINFQLKIQNYDFVMDKLLNDSNEIMEEYKAESNAYFYLGITYINFGQYMQAEKFLKTALDIKYNISYDYYYTLARSFNLLKRIGRSYTLDDEVKEKAKHLSNHIENIAHFVKNEGIDVRLQHWCNYLYLLGLYDSNKVIEKYHAIDSDLKNKESIVIVVSEAYYLEKNYVEAIPLLEKIFNSDALFLLRLLHSYDELDKWNLIEDIFKDDISHLYDQEGIVFFYKVELIERQGNPEDAVQLILNEGSAYNKQIWFVERVIKFSYKNHLYNLHNKFKQNLLEFDESLTLKDRLRISKTVFNQDEFELVRTILEPVYRSNQEAMDIYIYSFGEIDPKNDTFNIVKNIVKELYDEGNRSKYLLQTKFYIEFLTHRYLDAMESLAEYGNLIGEDSFYQLNIVQNVIFGCLDYDASKEINALMNNDILKYHIMVAQYFGYKGRWHEAKVLLSNSFYKYSEQIQEEEIAGFLKVYFINIPKNNDEAEYNRACDDCVILMKSSDGSIKNICIHSNDSVLQQNGENKLGCVNYKSSSDEGFMFKALAKKGAPISFEGNQYNVVEILNIHTYYFRHFLNRILVEYPENKTVIKVSGESVEEMIEKMSGFMGTNQKNIKERLDFYNFKIETGAPISYLSGKDNGKYFEAINYILNDRRQLFYSPYSNRTTKDVNYVLTISSIIILNSLGVLNKIEKISDKVCITPSLKSFIRKGIDDAIKYDAVVSTAFLDENNQFRMIESTEQNKEYKKEFWTELLLSINSLRVEKANQINTNYYDKLHEIVDVSEFESISIAEDKNITLVCDDLFIAKISKGIRSSDSTINSIGLLYLENLLSYDELLDVVLAASRYKIINCINHTMLFEIYNILLNDYGTKEYDNRFTKVKEIFNNLFSECTKGHNDILYQNFLKCFMLNGVMPSVLYKLVEEPFGLKSYEELIVEYIGN